MTRTFELGAAQLARPFEIPQTVWTNINSFVFLIGFDVQAAPGVINTEYASRFSQLPAYSSLYAAARQWGEETFPLLRQLASDVAAGPVTTLLEELDAAFAGMRGGAGTATTAVQDKLGELRQKISGLGQLGRRIFDQYARLDASTKLAVLQYESRGFAENRWVQIGPDVEGVREALGLMNGHWRALESDLVDLQRLVSKGAVDDIDIDVGLSTWRDMAGTATVFLTGIPDQQRYLSGDNYYDNNPPSETVPYLMVNQFLESRAGRPVLSADNTRTLKMTPLRPGDRYQEWMFRRIGRGWWKVTNRARGESVALDTGSLSPVGSYSGQAWRFLPTEYPEFVRLINSFTGEFKSLHTDGRTLTADMRPTEGYSGQYWKFVKADPTGT